MRRCSGALGLLLTVLGGAVARQETVWLEGNSSQDGCGLSLKVFRGCRPYCVESYLSATSVNLPPANQSLNGGGSSARRKGEGVQLTVTHPATGRVTFRKLFPLGDRWGHWLDMRWHLGRLQAGSLVALQVAGGNSLLGLKGAREDLRKLGSVLAEHLKESTHWTWVFILGGKTLHEAAVFGKIRSVRSNSQATLAEKVITTSKYIEENERLKFCMNHEALGSYCSIANRDPVRFTPKSLPNTDNLRNVPIMVIGGMRIAYLFRTLKSIFTAPGLRVENLEVLIGDTNESVLSLLRLMGIKYTRIPVSGVFNSKLFQFYRSCYIHVLDNYPASDAAIFIDEDVEVSPDFFSLHSQMIPLIHRDKTLYCATAHAYPAIPANLFGLNNKLKRAASQVRWGYALTLRFIKEAISKWPTDRVYSLLYDTWLNEEVASPRECVYPEISRTRHFGAGVNTEGYQLERYFLPVDMEMGIGINITNIDLIPRYNWYQHMVEEVKKAIPLNGNPCAPNFFHRRNNGTYIFYYSMKYDKEGYYRMDSYFYIGECINLWAFADRGSSEGLTFLRIRPGVNLYLMAVPMSTYSRYKHPGFEPWDFFNLSVTENLYVRQRAATFIHEHDLAMKNKFNSNMLMEDLWEVQNNLAVKNTARYE